MGLFSDLYNTVARFFRPQEEQEGEASKSVATNRLKLVLMQDRTNLTPRILEQMRSELIDLLSRYVELDKELLELNFEQEGDQVALMLSIPVIRAKDEEEIDAAIQAHKEAMEAESDEENSEENDEESDESEENSEENDISEDEEITDSEESNDSEITDSEEENKETESEENTEVAKKVKSKSKKSKKQITTPDEMTSVKSDSEEETNAEEAEEIQN